MGQDLWEQLCSQAVTWFLGQFPGFVTNGIDEGGINYPPLTNIALPALAGYDFGTALTGLCGLGSTESGDAMVSLTGVVLNGLETALLTSGQSVSFPAADTVMTIPITFGSITVTGTISIEQGCVVTKSQSQYDVIATGTFIVTTSEAAIVVTVSGLSADTGTASGVTIDWAGPTPLPTVSMTNLNYSPASPPPNQHVIPNYMTVFKKKLQEQIQSEVTDLLAGNAAINSNGQTLPGELLSIINEALSEVGNQ
jgi:hypothetical protein